jgi:hypothetical protein
MNPLANECQFLYLWDNLEYLIDGDLNPADSGKVERELQIEAGFCGRWEERL